MINKILLVLIFANFFIGCRKHTKPRYQVKCEDPYYNGLAHRAYTSEDGTFIEADNGASYKYPTSVKCEIIFR